MSSELTRQYVLAFPASQMARRAKNPSRSPTRNAAAQIILRRLVDAGFSVVPTEPPPVSDDVLLAGMQEVLKLRAEVDRLQDAKRRALQLADQRAREATELRLEDERLRSRLAECDRS